LDDGFGSLPRHLLCIEFNPVITVKKGSSALALLFPREENYVGIDKIPCDKVWVKNGVSLP
jgi:hypothetical protein